MIELYTSPTPNGHKISIALEEMGLDYEVKPIDLMNNEQKTEDFLSICPNGRIPAIVDTDKDNFAVFESGAILLYLSEITGKFLPSESKLRSEVIQWVMFQMSGIGPMQGQAHVFYRYAPMQIEYAIKRFQNETLRLYKVLNEQLKNYEYLAGDFSIADIATWPWINRHVWAGISINELSHLVRWMQILSEREAFKKGVNVPFNLNSNKLNEKNAIKKVRKFLI